MQCSLCESSEIAEAVWEQAKYERLHTHQVVSSLFGAELHLSSNGGFSPILAYADGIITDGVEG